MADGHISISKVYTFVAATILLDLDTPMGKAFVQQLVPFACQNLEGNQEFSQLYAQVEKENTPVELGTGIYESNSTDAFGKWLESKGKDINIKPGDGKISFFAGDAQNPQDGRSFKWCVFFYFDFTK